MLGAVEAGRYETRNSFGPSSELGIECGTCGEEGYHDGFLEIGESLKKEVKNKMGNTQKTKWVKPKFGQEGQDTWIQPVEKGQGEKSKLGFRFQVADVKKPLVSVKRITEKGNHVQFGPGEKDNFILNKEGMGKDHTC